MKEKGWNGKKCVEKKHDRRLAGGRLRSNLKKPKIRFA